MTICQLYVEVSNNDDMEEHQNASFLEVLRLRQASIHPSIALSGLRKKQRFHYLPHYKPSFRSTKIDAIMRLLVERSKTENCLVFCHFKEEMDLLSHFLNQEGIHHAQYNGKMTLSQRNKCLKQFSYIKLIEKCIPKKFSISDRSLHHILSFIPHRILLIQIKAGGVGLNLQQFTQVFITSPDWNPSNEIQAVARAHRIGQEFPVCVNRFRLQDSEKVGSHNYISTIDNRIFNIKKKGRTYGEYFAGHITKI